MIKAIALVMWGLVLLIPLVGCKSTQQVRFDTIEQQQKIAIAAYQQGDLHIAEGYWRKIVSAMPEHAQSWCQLGHVNYRLHRYQAASNAYQRCLNLAPEQANIWHNLAAVKLRQATELLLTGQAYLEVAEGRVETHSFAYNYQRLMAELVRFHGVADKSIELTYEP